MNKTILGIIIIIIVAAGAFFFANNDATAPTNENETSTPVDEPADNNNGGETATDEEPQTYTISMTDSGFAPSSISIRAGDTVSFVNNGTKLIWPASSPHPTHTDYSAFDPREGVAVGGTWTFTFNEAGTYRFHDHLNPTRFGSVTVTE